MYRSADLELIMYVRLLDKILLCSSGCLPLVFFSLLSTEIADVHIAGSHGNFCFGLLTVSHQTWGETDNERILYKTSNISYSYPTLILVTILCEVYILFKVGQDLQSLGVYRW